MQLTGTAANDALVGSMVEDTLDGGSGADVFTFNSATGNDLIVDFDPTLDRISTGGWAALNGVRFFQDVSGNTLVTIAGLSNITLQGVTQAQWSSIREADDSAPYTPSPTPTDDYAASTATTGRVTVGGTGTSGRIETSGDNCRCHGGYAVPFQSVGPRWRRRHPTGPAAATA